MANMFLDEEILRKYKLAGRIRFISFSLLLLFLFLMKSVGGYSYLNISFIILVFVEAVVNQPYLFFIRRVNVNRFQYYQMATDIVAITWIIHYMGGIDAPLINIAYYAVILWAGVVSTTGAVFFAVILASILYAFIVLSVHFGLIPYVSLVEYDLSLSRMSSVLVGNISFMFAFGYFCAHSSRVIKFLERRRQEDSLRSAHKLVSTGHLVSNIAHDVLNHLSSIRGYIELLLIKTQRGSKEYQMLDSVSKLEKQSSDLLSRLFKFSRKPRKEFRKENVNDIIRDVLELTQPFTKYSKMKIENDFASDIPDVSSDKEQLQEVFIVMVLNALDAIKDVGTLKIKTVYEKSKNCVEIIFSDTGEGIKKEDLKHIGEPFFTTKGSEKGLGMGLPSAFEIVNRHKGKIDIKSTEGVGTTFTVSLPLG